MNFDQSLKSLALDQWYKLLVLVGGISTLGSLFIEVKVLSNTLITPIAFGLFLIGLGEWASHRRTKFKRKTDHGSTATGFEMQRFNNISGNSMTLIGFVILVYGVFLIAIS
jgi:hypothetical protein